MWVRGLCPCQCQRWCTCRQNKLLNPLVPLYDPTLLLATEVLGVTNCNVLPLIILCSLYISIQIKTMASTSSVSQVSDWTWSWDNLPRSSFLLHQMRASVCLSLVSFPFSHLLLTFIIQIRMLSTKTDGRRDGWCRSPCSPCASPWATKWQPIVSDSLYAS